MFYVVDRVFVKQSRELLGWAKEKSIYLATIANKDESQIRPLGKFFFYVISSNLWINAD